MTDEQQKMHDGKIRPLAVALITKGNKILANKGYDPTKQEVFYRLPGGGIEFGEKAEDTLKRELKEENGIDIIVGKQLGVLENIFEFDGKKGHEIAFVFEAKLPDECKEKDKIPIIEKQKAREFSEFVEIMPQNKIYPENALKLLKNK